MAEEEIKKKKKNFNIFIGVAVIVFIVILITLLATKLATLKQVLLLLGIVAIIVAIGFLVYFIYSRQVKRALEEPKLKDQQYYIQKMWDHLLEKGIQPEKFEVSNRLVGRSGDWMIFCKYKNYWYPYEKGYLVMDAKNERISECKDEKELQDTLFGLASKPVMFIKKGKASKSLLGEEEEYEEIPYEEAEKIEQEKKEKELRKV